MAERIDHFIGGRMLAGRSGRAAQVFDSATGEVCGEVALADAADTDAAVAAAEAAFAGWSATPPLQRARVLFRFKTLLEQHHDDLVGLISREHGKLPDDAHGEWTRGLEVVEFACGIPQLLKGEHSMNVGSGIDSWSELYPLGVVAGITPFNFPLMVPMWMVPIALACGNTFVLKPSEQDPSPSMLVARLLQQAGLPDGAFNVLHGDRQAVDALLQDARVQAVSFVGSTAVAEHVYATGSRHGKRVQALGGAKNHAVVMPDADVEQAADALMGAAYGSAGQRCMAVSVVVAVGDAVADALVAGLAARVRGLRIGAAQARGRQQGVDMGPLISRAHLRKVLAHVEAGVAEGATLVVDGRQAALPPGDGFFLGGCLFDHVQPHMRIYREEIFGPVLCVVRVADLTTACALVNTHAYGNGASIYTRDGAGARHFARNVQAGMVGINVVIPVPMAFHSFGGWKRSLYGPLHVHGSDGVRFYTRMKTTTARWSTESPRRPDYHATGL